MLFYRHILTTICRTSCWTWAPARVVWCWRPLWLAPFLCLGSDPPGGGWLYHPKMACFSMRNNGEKTDFSYVFWRLYHLTWIVSPGKMGKRVAHLCIFILGLKLYMNGFGLFNQEKCWYNGDVAKNIVTWGKTIDGWKHIWCKSVLLTLLK